MAWWLGLIVLAAALLLVPAMPEPHIFRELADERAIFGIASFWNVVSNVPLFLGGVWGLVAVARASSTSFAVPAERWPYFFAFAAIALAGIGSTYYHVAPDSDRLMWDRLPIALAFMALLSALLAERVNIETGIRSLAPLLSAGALSAIYWRWSALHGAENILPYALVQYGAFAAIVALAAFVRPRYTRSADLFIVAALYAAAKVTEVLDGQIFGLGGVLSGHTLKHLLVALSVWWLARMLVRRRPIEAACR